VRNASPGTVLTCLPTIDPGTGLDWLARTVMPAVNT
jgi:hypothetical protein